MASHTTHLMASLGMADLKGDPLNPLYFCNFTRADAKTKLFYQSVIDTAQRFGSVMMPAPEKPVGHSVETICSGSSLEVRKGQVEWERKWGTDPSVLDQGRDGGAMLFNAENPQCQHSVLSR